MIYEIPIVPPSDESLSDSPNWRQWTWWLRPIVAIPLMLFVLLLLSPFLVRAWHLSKVPDIADPFDVEAFLSETVDDKDNAFVDYHAAQVLLVPKSSLTSEEWNEIDLGWEKTSAPVRSWVDGNLPALERWRVGTEKTDANDGDLRNDPWLSLPEVIPARDFSDLAWLQGERKHSEGHMAEAWQWYRAVIRFSRHVGQRKGSIGRTLGSSLYGSTAKRIVYWASDSRTSRDELQLALSQLTEDFRLTRPFSELLKVEYCDLPKYAWVWEESEFRHTFGTRSPDWRDSRFIRYCLGEPELTIRWNKLAIENWLAASDLPRRLQRRITSTNGCVLDLIAPGSGISGATVIRMIEVTERGSVTNFASARDYFDVGIARQETLRLTLACQLWFRQHGAFPPKLEDLVPDILSELPIDPFSKADESFHYLRDGEGFIIYSFGSNETDELGSEEALRNWHDNGYRIEPPLIREQATEQKAVDEP